MLKPLNLNLLSWLVIAIVLLGVVTTVWGGGPVASVPLFAIGAILMALTWPTRAKTELLLRRAAALRES